MRVVFMGTPDIAVEVLNGLICSKKHEVVEVVTQPDRPRGRSGKPAFSPVKEVAIKENIPVFQPEKIKLADSVEHLKSLDFDVIVVVAFGQILSKEILDMPKYGCINVHASLLPRWRGAGPIQWAILAGDEKTGVTTMQMDVGLDTGDMLLKQEIAIEPDETGGSLFDKMAKLGSRLLLETLDGVEEGTITPESQKDEDSTYAKMLTKDMGNLDFTKSAKEVDCYIRGLNPWPSAFTHYEGKTLKLWRAKVADDIEGLKPGQIGRITKDTFSIQTGEGSLVIYELQMEGKKRMNTADFLRGVSVKEGVCLC